MSLYFSSYLVVCTTTDTKEHRTTHVEVFLAVEEGSKMKNIIPVTNSLFVFKLLVSGESCRPDKPSPMKMQTLRLQITIKKRMQNIINSVFHSKQGKEKKTEYNQYILMETT